MEGAVGVLSDGSQNSTIQCESELQVDRFLQMPGATRHIKNTADSSFFLRLVSDIDANFHSLAKQERTHITWFCRQSTPQVRLE